MAVSKLKDQTRHAAEEAAASFPSLLVEAERIAQTVTAGLHGRRRAGPGETFWQHRPYIFGDPVSAIDWRQSARSADRLFVRQNEWDAAQAVWIWRDASRSLDFSSHKKLPTKRRRADIIATALAVLLSNAGEKIGLLGEPRSFHGRSAPNRFLERLDISKFDERASSPPDTHLAQNAHVVLISDFFTEPEAVQKSVTHFATQGISGVMLQVTDPAEEAFPFSGRTEFQDSESRDQRLFGDAAAIGDDYREAYAAHNKTLRGLADYAGWRFIAHNTEQKPEAALLALHLALGGDRHMGR